MTTAKPFGSGVNSAHRVVAPPRLGPTQASAPRLALHPHAPPSRPRAKSDRLLDARQVAVEQFGKALRVQAELVAYRGMAEWIRVFYQDADPLPDSFLAQRHDAPAQARNWD